MNLAYIPVRGGSKSIPLKNIKPIACRPLVYWSVKAASECADIDAVYVSTDSDIIGDTVAKFNIDRVHIVGRSAESASDTATTEYGMLEFAEERDFTNIVLIQATSPLVTAGDLHKGFLLQRENGVDSVLSTVRQKRFIWHSSEFVTPMNYDPANRPRRQGFDGFLVENGAFYITSRELLLKTRCRISGNIKAVEMSSDAYFEVDEPEDWMIVEALMRKRMGEILCPEG